VIYCLQQTAFACYSLAAIVDPFLDRLDTGTGNGTVGLFDQTQNRTKIFAANSKRPRESNGCLSGATAQRRGTLTENLYQPSPMAPPLPSSHLAWMPFQLLAEAGGTSHRVPGFTASKDRWFHRRADYFGPHLQPERRVTLPTTGAAVAITNQLNVSTALSPASATLQLAPTANFVRFGQPIFVGTSVLAIIHRGQRLHGYHARRADRSHDQQCHSSGAVLSKRILDITDSRYPRDFRIGRHRYNGAAVKWTGRASQFRRGK